MKRASLRKTDANENRSASFIGSFFNNYLHRKISVLQYYFLVVVFHVLTITAYSLTADFSYSKRSNCAPAEVVFSNNSSTGTNVNYTWDFGLGSVASTSDNSSREQLYTTPGQYIVTLTVSDGTSTVSKSTTITIAQGPNANFSAVPLYGCSPLLVQYTSTSTAGSVSITSFAWDFRNGDYASGASTQYTYADPGKYDVVLKVTDQNGCYSLVESDSLITVVNKPVVNFKATDTFSCTPPLNVSFINLSTGASNLSYEWDYGNGQTSTDLSNSSVYSAIGYYDVKLTVTDQYGCKDSLTKESYIKIGNEQGTISVYDSNGNIVNKTSLCSGTYKFVFSLTDLPDYTWTVQDNDVITQLTGQSTLTYSVKDTGTLTITLVYGKNSSCTDKVSTTYTKSSINASFTLDTALFCSVPQKVNLQNASQNASSYSWYLSNQLFSTSDNASYTITKKDLSSVTYQQLYNHEINTITLPFSLVATNNAGCSDSTSQIATISLPTARFMPDKVSGCIPLQVIFSDSSKSAFSINEYTYKIGAESITSSSKSPVTYTFTKPGEYLVSEIIKSENCYDTSYTVKVVVGEKLKPDFTVTPAEVCNGGEIHVTASSNNNSVVKGWLLKSLNLFNYSFSSKPDTSIVVYSDTTGPKSISLQLDYNGCFSDTTKKDIFKIIGPVGNFTDSFSCLSPLVYHFKSQIPLATSLAWAIDTAKSTNIDTVSYKFPSSGNYTVKLTASDNVSGCALTRSKVLKVRQVKAAFTVEDSVFCAGDTVYLYASSSKDYINSCYNEGFLWDFGDHSQTRRVFTSSYYHIYTAKGSDTLLLVTTADNGCTDSTKKIIRILKPEGTFTTDKDSGCLTALTVQFINTTTDSTVVKWKWNFGDGSTDDTNTKIISHNYSSTIAQTYNSSITVYDAYQCSGSFSLPITLIGVNSDFQADDNAICVGQMVTFSPVDTTLDSLYWDYGNGKTTYDTITYTKQGTYSVSLTATKGGCSGTTTKSNYISVEKADANFTVSDSILYCYPDTVYFVHNSAIGSTGIDKIWTFDTHSVTGNDSDTAKYIYTKAGNYKVTYTIKTLNNCKASSSKNIVITGPTAYASFSPHKICYNGLVNFQLDSISNITSWKWLFGDGNTSIDNPAAHRYTSRGKIVPAVELINQNCTTTKTLDTLSIANVKADYYTVSDISKICSGSTVDFLNQSVAATSYNWQINSISTSTDYNLSNISFNKTGDYNVTLIATDADNCTDTVLKKYTVVASPVFTINGATTMCYGKDSVILSVSQDAGSTITWSPASDLSSRYTFTTVAKPASTITYTAEVTNASGCSSTSEKTITVTQPFTVSRVPLGDTSINIGDQIQLIALVSDNSVSYTWTPDYNISCLTCYNPYVSPAKDITYQVEIKNACFDIIEYFNIKIIIDFYLEAPTAFSPNGDLNNDVYKFEAKNITQFDLKIFNRWGEVVFASTDVNKGWDGKVNGFIQNIDTYTYYVKAETNYGYKFEKKGSFLLLK